MNIFNMFQYYKCIILNYMILGSFSAIQNSYLDKMVEYYKQSLFQDLRDLPTTNLTVSVERAPTNYKDDKAWNTTSVMRLLSLLRNSPDTPQAVRRMANLLSVQQHRRFYSKFSDSFQLFPSLSQNLGINLYYDLEEYNLNEQNFPIDSGPDITNLPNDDDIIIISNPIEARLPSAQISVRCLKNILEARAYNAKYLPTTKREYTWPYTKVNSNGTASTSISSTDNYLK